MFVRSNFSEKRCVYSVEVFPPKKVANWENFQKTLRKIKTTAPAFISVTCGAGGSGTEGVPTSQAAAFIKNELGIEPLTHVTCVSYGRDEIDGYLDGLYNSGIRNIMCLRGDLNPELPKRKDFRHASDLVAHIQKTFGRFGLSGACYPEHHPESETLREDVENLLIKQEAGASHLVSQLFFDNYYYYRFASLARKVGVTLPISVGVMPIVKKVHIANVVNLSGATIPPKFATLLDRWQDDPDGLKKAGTDYAIEQCRDLIEAGVDGIHIYAMNNSEVTLNIYEGIKDLL